MNAAAPTSAPEWRHMLRVLELDKPLSVTIAPSAAERAALAKRCAVPAIESLEARLTVAPETGRYHVTGGFKAVLNQACVRSGVALTVDLESEVEGWFAEKEGTISFAKARKQRDEDMGDQPNFVEESDDPEPLDNGAIDLGELVAQHLCLAVDPYPVSPGAEPLPEEGTEGKVKLDNPFAILGQLRDFIGKDE